MSTQSLPKLPNSLEDQLARQGQELREIVELVGLLHQVEKLHSESINTLREAVELLSVVVARRG